MYLTKFFFILLLIKSSVIYAVELDSPYIQQFVKTYLTEKFPSSENKTVQISVAPLDPRITIKACDSPLIANIPDKNNAVNISVKVSCSAPLPWKLYLSAKISITKAVLVAKQTISKGDTLNNDNIELVHKVTNRIRGDILTDMAIILGAKAKRRIAKGKTINKNSICLICKGDLVTIIASSESFSIKTRGVALTSGNINEQIKVKNIRSNKVITPRIKTTNQVVINL